MARGTTRGSPGAKTDSNGNIEPRDPRPDSPKTILSLTSSIPGAFPDDVASIASIKSGIAPAVPGMLGALTGSSDKPLPDTQSETNSSGELRNEAIAGTSPTGSGGIREGSNDIGGYPTTNAYVTEPPPERKPASDTEETPAAEGSQHEALNMAIGSGSPDMGWRVMGIGASGTPGARRANL
ncbi:MAG: hypothetical protein M1840_007148 [Geoglossum simile]|nr:MAG: hypothetical protein M1840_007148 [Geoglossum simile]